MIQIVQWVALVASVGCTAWRLPAMLQGRNRSLFWAFLAISLSMAFSISAIYMPVDEFLGARNFTNVILRFSLFTAAYLLAGKIAAAYGSPLGYKLVRGPIGIVVLAVCSAGIWVSYLRSDLEGSSTGLAGFESDIWLSTYTWFGFAYPAYAAACLVIPTGKAAVSKRSPLDRTAASFLCLGFILVCSAVVLMLSPLGFSPATSYVSFGSIVCIAFGMALVWFSFIRRPLKH